MLMALQFSCKKENKITNNTPSSPHVYSSSTYVNNLSAVMGGCLDSNGYLVSFTLPLMQSSSFGSNALISGKIIKNKAPFSDSTLIDFQNTPFSFGSLYSNTINNINGWTPRWARVSLAYTKKGALFMASNNNNGNRLCQISNGNSYQYHVIDGLTAITSLNNDIYAISTPIYNQSLNNILTQATIYKVDSIGNLSTYYTFPSNIIFNSNCGYGSGVQKNYPLDVLIDIKARKDSSIFIVSGYDNIIYKLDKNKNLSVYCQNIFCPVSIDFDQNNQMYVVSAPKYSTDVNQNSIMTKPIQVYKITNNNQNIIYESGLSNYTGCLYNKLGTDQSMISDANIKLIVKSEYNIFLENPYEGKILLLQ